MDLKSVSYKFNSYQLNQFLLTYKIFVSLCLLCKIKIKLSRFELKENV